MTGRRTAWVRPAWITESRRIGRFAAVGLSGVAVNMAVLVFLAEAGGLPPEIAAVLATECAILSNFAWNDRWTFAHASTSHSWPGRALRYNLIALGGLVITVTLLAILVNLVGLHYVPANLIAIAGATGWNYAVNGALTWSLWGAGVRRRLLTSRVAALRVVATFLAGGG